MAKQENAAYIICGPTASGKSAYALEIAKKVGGVIINADSMQVYDGLNKLTASPDDHAKQEVEHLLYNFLSPDAKYSVVSYISDCYDALSHCKNNNLIPVITGGTGMYINAIMQGISPIPDIPQEIREEVLGELSEYGLSHIFEKLSEVDAVSSVKLKPNDTQRIIRAYEVAKYTGKPISEFQKQGGKAILENYKVKTIYIKPEREILYKSCNERFISMMKNGAIEEVKAFWSKFPYLTSGCANALGYKEIVSYLKSEISLNQAVILAQNKTRQYAKRQTTWFNHQLKWEYEVQALD